MIAAIKYKKRSFNDEMVINFIRSYYQIDYHLNHNRNIVYCLVMNNNITV